MGPRCCRPWWLMKAVPWQRFPGNGAMATAPWQRESAKGMWGDAQGDVGGYSWKQRDHGTPPGPGHPPQAWPPSSTGEPKLWHHWGLLRGFWCSQSILGARKVILGAPSSSGASSPDKEQRERAGTWGMTPWELPAAVPRPGAGPTHTRVSKHTPVHAPLLCLGSPALSSPADAAVSHHHKGSP